MPSAKKPKPARTARRTRMVAAKLSGATVKAIAAGERISRQYATRELATSESRQIVIGLATANLPVVSALYQRALASIDAAFDANLLIRVKGKTVVLGPDHYARLNASQALLRLLVAGRAVAKPPEDEQKERTITLEQLNQLIESRKAAAIQ